MKIYRGIVLLIILLFAGCDTKDIVTGVAKVEYEKLKRDFDDLLKEKKNLEDIKNELNLKVNNLLKENKDLEEAKKNLSLKVDNMVKENDNLKQELEKYKNRFEKASTMFK